MSFRKKTIKFGETFGTPTTPTPTPKAPSPKQPKIVRTITPTVTTGVRVTSKPTATRGVIPQQAAGIAAQEQFKTRLQSLTAPIYKALQPLYDYAKTYNYQRFATATEKDLHQRKIKELEQKNIDIETKLIQEQQVIEEKKIETELAGNVQQIISALESGNLVYPDWYQNNIAWVKTGHITSKEFLDTYYYLTNQGIIHSQIVEPIIEEPLIELPQLLPEVSAEPDISITDNMVTQQVINFNIINGRAVGSIKFLATNNFNSFWYGKNIVNIIQFKDPNGANILTYVKENRLNFTETEPDEVINYDEDMKGNTRATVESFVWSSATQPTAFSKKYTIDISEKEPPKPIQAGFMGAGALGALAGLILIGFIADHKRGK